MPPRPKDHDESKFEDALLDAVGDVSGARVLELGCGDGELVLRLVDAGAEVIAVDISPSMVELGAARLARFRPGGTARFIVATAEDTGLESESQDIVVGKWVLHHVDVRAAVREIHRVLRPGGIGAFVETSALNPLLRFARRRIAGRFGTTSFGTPDEHPLTRADIDLLQEQFGECRLDFPNFVFFYLLDRHVTDWRWEAFSRWCLRLDDLVERRIPALHPASYYLRVVVRK